MRIDMASEQHARHRVAALLYEEDDPNPQCARYASTVADDAFFARHGEGDPLLGRSRVCENGKIDPDEFFFFEPEDATVCVRPAEVYQSSADQLDKLMMLEADGALSLANSFAYLLRRTRILRYESCLSMLVGLRAYNRHVLLGAKSCADSPNSTLDLGLLEGLGEVALAGGGRAADLHMPVKDVYQACLTLEAWLRSQSTYENDLEVAECLRQSLDSKLVALLDEQLTALEKELVLGAKDMFSFPDFYGDLARRHAAGESLDRDDPLAFTEQELLSEVPRNMSLEDEARVGLYCRVVSQAVDSYFFSSGATVELWAFNSSPVRWRARESGGRVGSCMRFLASKPLSDLTDTKVKDVVYIAETGVGIRLIALRKNLL